MGDINKLFAQGQAGNSLPNAEKPAVAITAPLLAVGINGADAKGLDNLSSQSITGKDLFKAPEEGGQAIMSWSSKPSGPKNWVEKILAAAANDLGIGKVNKDGSSSGGSSGGGGGGDSGSTSSSAPVSSGGSSSSSSSSSSASSSSGSYNSGGGGGGTSGGGGGGSTDTSFRGGSSDVSLTAAIAAVQGINLAPMQDLVGPALQVHMDHTPAPPPPVVAPQAAMDEIQR